MRGLPSARFQGVPRALLLACAIDPAPAALAEVRALVPRLDWDGFVDLAVRGGVAPLVWRTVKRADLPVPPAAAHRLRAAYALNAIRNARFAEEVARLTAALEAAGIPCLPLKGAGLMHTLYPDPALRTLADLDLLVPRPQARHAERVVADAGYRCAEPGGLGRLGARWLNHHVVFSRVAEDGAAFALELHFGLLTRFGARLDLAAVWRRARTVTAGGRAIRALAPEDEALYLAGHFVVHLCEPQLKWLVDLAEVIARGGLDWHALTARVRAYGLRLACYEAWRRAQALLGAPVPAAARAPRAPPTLARAALARLAPLEVTLGLELPPAWAQHAAALLVVDGPAARVRATAFSLGRKLLAGAGARLDARA